MVLVWSPGQAPIRRTQDAGFAIFIFKRHSRFTRWNGSLSPVDPVRRLKGFVSYSHEDKLICDEIKKPLTIIAKMFDIAGFWVDESTSTGRCFRKGYEEAIEAASIHVLILSASYLWSQEIMERELPLINDKQNRDGDLLLPVIADDCLWGSVIGSVLAAPTDDRLTLKPLIEWRPLRKGINRVGEQFSKAIADHFGIEPRQLFHWRSP